MNNCSLYENTTKIIPELFSVEVSLNDCENFFKLINKFIRFSECYVFLINPESIQFKNSYKGRTKYKYDYTIDITKDLFQLIFNTKKRILDNNSKLIKILNLQSDYYALSGLSIRGSVYGFVLYGKESIFTDDERISLKTCTEVLSYKIKENELSNVFKIQTKALKDAVKETNEAYKTIKVQNKKILSADKVKNEFLASVSHELRTPLNAIIGFSDILKTQFYGELSDKQTEYVNDIQTSALQLLGMVNEILDISKIESNAVKLIKQYFEISRPVIETTNMLMPLVKKKNINLTYHIVKDIDIYADYQKIQQILYNLLSNAIKYTPEKGKIEINVSNTYKNVRISVKDNGIGIDKKYHKKIFGKFVQLEDAFYKKETSTGLGLTITKYLTELHKGKIRVESEKGKGADFIVILPIEEK